MKRWFCLSAALFIALGICAQEKSSAYEIGVEGIKNIDEGNYQEGIRLLKQARNLEPQDFDYSFEIGKAYLKSGSPKKAEKYLFPLQYHANVHADFFVALANCYREIEDAKKTPNPDRKKELDALRYGIQKLPQAGELYLELANRKLDMDKPVEALAVFENGILKAPNFAENYFWAAKLLKAAGNELWAWIYAETFFNMTESEEMKRSAALLISSTSQVVFSKSWQPEPDKMDQELRYMVSEKCDKNAEGWNAVLSQRNCLLKNWDNTSFPIASLIERMKTLQSKGYLDAYLATIYLETDRTAFLSWVSGNAQVFEEYRKWRFWNPHTQSNPLQRIAG